MWFEVNKDAGQQVLGAATHLVSCFAAHNTEAYFACFSPSASFIFYNHSEILQSRSQYHRLWKYWEDTVAFRVLGCTSTSNTVKMIGDIGLFTHVVETEVSLSGLEYKMHERETILFKRDESGRWLAIHEHLSPFGTDSN